MLIALSIVIFLVFLFIWVYPPFRRQGREGMPAMKWYLFALLITAVAGFAAAVGLQLLLQPVIDRMNVPAAVTTLLDAFVSAAIIEEIIKFVGGRVLLGPSGAARKIDYIFLFAASGIGFELTESVFSVLDGNIVASVIRGVLCYHVFWQAFMGAHYYEYRRAKKDGRTAAAVGQFFLFLVVPVLLHGLNDYGTLWLMDIVPTDGSAVQDAAQLLPAIAVFILSLLVGIAFMVYTVIMLHREAKRSRTADAPAAEEPAEP